MTTPFCRPSSTRLYVRILHPTINNSVLNPTAFEGLLAVELFSYLFDALDGAAWALGEEAQEAESASLTVRAIAWAPGGERGFRTAPATSSGDAGGTCWTTPSTTSTPASRRRDALRAARTITVSGFGEPAYVATATISASCRSSG